MLENAAYHPLTLEAWIPFYLSLNDAFQDDLVGSLHLDD